MSESQRSCLRTGNVLTRSSTKFGREPLANWSLRVEFRPGNEWFFFNFRALFSEKQSAVQEDIIFSINSQYLMMSCEMN